MDWRELQSEKHLDELLDTIRKKGAPTLLLKHSGTCMISLTAKSRLERKCDSRLNYYLIDVISKRSVSNSLASILGVKHESPQSFLWVNSELVNVSSHLSISPYDISSLLDEAGLNFN